MKKLVGIFLITILALTSCNNQEPKTETAENKPLQVDPRLEFAKLNKFLRKFDEPLQTFIEGTNKIVKVKGKQGTIIFINPFDLETESGQPIGKDVEIELKELSNQQQLLRANAQTVSDGQLLVSGGACFINVTSDGKKVKLSKGKTYSVTFPKLSGDEMTLYYGQRDSSNKINWKLSDQKLETQKEVIKQGLVANMVLTKSIIKDTIKVPMENKTQEEIQKIYGESKISNKVYQPVSLNQFGWINCDRLFQPSARRTNVMFAFANNSKEVNYVNMYLIFGEIKSIMQNSYYFYDNKVEGNIFENIPVGMKVRFLAVAYQHEKIFATLTDTMQVKENLNENLSLKEMSETELDKLIKSVQ